MTVIAPPKPSRHDPLEALIEEARRRARRRRLIVIAVLLAGAAGGAVWAALALSSGGTAAANVPPGFHLVKAQGPVAHQVVGMHRLGQPTSVDLATGTGRPASWTREVWFDPRSGLARVVDRVDGRVRSDSVYSCGPLTPGAQCLPNEGFALARYWPIDSKRYVREPGMGSFHGRKVIWLGVRENGFPPANGDGTRVGLDPRTHEPVAYEVFEKFGLLMTASWIKARKPDIPADRFSFVVPNGGIGPRYPVPSGEKEFSAAGSNPFAVRAQKALERRPLWLGSSFGGNRLRSFSISSEWLETRAGTRLLPATSVTYDYGDLFVREFGSSRPYWYEQGPRPGAVAVEKEPTIHLGKRPNTMAVRFLDERAVLSRDGLLVIVTSLKAHLTRDRVIELAKALRPVSAG